MIKVIAGMIRIVILFAGSTLAQGAKTGHTDGFDGLWDTSFGMMRLHVDGEDVHGSYRYQDGVSVVSGQIKDERFIFRYTESNAQGTGWFTLSDDGAAIRGKWRADGQDAWQDWTGQRATPRRDRVWLLIFEANWERNISEPEYAFGEMLANYFTMATARHVQVRHRFFHDSTDLMRFCREVQFLAEPVVVLISTHGTSEGITVNGETIQATTIAKGLSNADNLKLLHLSGCAMMQGDFAQNIHSSMGKGATFPISGYRTNVAWDASAIGDFTYLSMLLIRRMSPQKAARQAITASPFLGNDKIPGTSFKPLGLTVLPAPAGVKSLPSTSDPIAPD
tara:strand:- start:265280 stop:266287 length:1008 start_codon:yes stop_codon:yes gene_type:complete